MSTVDNDTVARKVTLRRDATLTVAADGVELTSSHVTARLSRLDPASTAILERLASGPASEPELTVGDRMQAAMRTQLLLRKLNGAGWLEHVVTLGEAPLAGLRPLGFGAVEVDRATAPPHTAWLLSRFALARRDADVLLVESPLSPLAVELTDPRSAALLGAVTTGTEVSSAATAVGVPETATAAVFDLLAAAGLLVRVGDTDEDDQFRFMQWSPAELWLHATSRSGRRGTGYGGTYRFKDRIDPLPTVPEPTGGARIGLSAPDLDALEQTDPSLTAVIERRRSVREHDDDHPIDVDQLGELLHRGVRIRRTGGADGDVLVDRPYPSGGSLGEMSFYVVAVRCEGLPPGIWRYDASGHAFEHVADMTAPAREMLVHARAASLMSSDPQVLVVLAARFGRVMWKYESLGYALILKHVGVAYQTLYLIAEAMGLAACAQGGGSADLFAAATGLDYYAEGSVGEFLVGSRPANPVLEWER